MNTPANRRTSRRTPARSGLTTVCRLGALDLGPNVALSVLDLSDTGARLAVREPFKVGQTVFLTLTASSNGFTVKRPAKVMWSSPAGANGPAEAGLLFEKPVSYKDLFHVARI
jgi:hypothetical protein